jgi:putative ABC transport system permease protein
LIGIGISRVLHLFVPALPVHTPVLFVFVAEGVAIVIGLVSGVLPARNAASLEPVEAIRAE